VLTDPFSCLADRIISGLDAVVSAVARYSMFETDGRRPEKTGMAALIWIASICELGLKV
jgi:hypothetical protein